jgi:tetratricopeptide (TPR) repeat protein
VESVSDDQAPVVRDALIVYCDADEAWAAWIEEALEDHGCATRRWSWPASKVDLDQAMRDALAGADRCVVVVSEAFRSLADYPESEWRSALGPNQPDLERLLPILVDRAQIPEMLSREFREQVIDLADIGEQPARERLIPGVTGRPASRRIAARTARGTTRQRFPGDEPAVWGRVPHRNHDFIGREKEIKTLHDTLRRAPNGAAIAVLTGMGGVGKTQIAVEYAYRYQSEYDVVWFIDATRSAVARQDLLALNSELNFLTEDVGRQAGLEAALEAMREDARGRRWLVIIDDARNAEAIQPVLPRFTGRFGHVLITSTAVNWSEIGTTLPVDPMDAESSRAFFESRLRRLGEYEDDIPALLVYCDGLPAAMDVACSHLQATLQPVREFLAQAQKSPVQALNVLLPRYPRPLVETYKVGLDSVTDLDPAAGQFLRLLSFMASDPIPIQVFAGLSASEGHDLLSDLTRAFGDPADQSRVRVLLSETRQHSLARVQLVHDEPAVEMHRVPQAIIAANVSRDEAEVYRHVVHQLLRARDVGPARSTDEWRTMLAIWRNLEASGAWTCVKCGQDQSTRTLILHVIRAMMVWGESWHAWLTAKTVTETWVPIIGADHTDVREARLDMANALRNQGRATESLAIDEELAASVGADPDARRDIAIRVGLNRGGDLRRLGRYAEARVVDEETLAMAQSNFDRTDRLTMMARDNMAVTYLLLGEPRKALDSDELLRGDQAKVRGDNDRATLDTRTRIAHAYLDIGNYRAALERQEQTVRKCLQVLGSESITTLSAQMVLTTCLRHVGDYDKAWSLAQTTVDLMSKVLGPDHPDTIMALTELANCERTIGRRDRALKSSKTAVERSKQSNGEEHPSTAICMNNFALAHLAHAQPDEAVPLLRSAENIVEAAFPNNHPHPFIVRANLATAYWQQRNYTAADELELELQPLLVQIGGTNHPIALAFRVNRVTTMDSRQARGANLMATETIEDFTRILGPEHPDTQTAMNRSERILISVDAVAV